MDFGAPYWPAQPPELKALPYPAPDAFDAPPPLTGGYDSYDKWTNTKKLKLHHLIEVENGFASRNGNVFDAEGRRVTLASHKSKANIRFFSAERNAWRSVKPWGPKPTMLYDGEVIVATASTAKFYYHGLLEIVPKLVMAQKQGLSPRYPVYIDASQPFMRECLQALKIDNIIDASIHPRIQARQLMVPCYEITNGDSIPKWSVDALNQLFPPQQSADAKPHRKLYLSRKKAGRRQINNETEVAAFLQHKGFETVFPEQMTIQEQADLFRQASIVAGPSGGAFTNIAFCRPGTTIINVFYWQADNCFQKLCAAAALNYAYVGSRARICENLEYKMRKVSIGNRDYKIEIEDLVKTYEKLF